MQCKRTTDNHWIRSLVRVSTKGQESTYYSSRYTLYYLVFLAPFVSEQWISFFLLQ